MKSGAFALACFCGTFAAGSFGGTLYVSSTATGGGDGSELNPYTMSEAWKNVKAKDTIQLADGTYVEETVRGDSSCFTVRDKPNVTFQGNVEHPENVIIDFNGTSIRGFYSPNQPFTIRGITFQNKNTNGSPGVIATGGSTSGQAIVENCRFLNIKTTQTSGDGRMGTVFRCGMTTDFIVRNCVIDNVDSYQWSAMYVTAGTLTLQHCTVSNCYAKTGTGSVAGLNGGTALTIEDSDFVNIGSTRDFTGDYYSGVIHVNSGATPKIVIRRSRFWNDISHGVRLGGFSQLSNGQTMTFEDCEFYDFKVGSGWGGLFYVPKDNAATIEMSGCVVSNASCQTNGGVFGINGSGTKIVLNDCHFMDCFTYSTETGAIGGLLYGAVGLTLAMTNCVCETSENFAGYQAYNGGQINISNVGGVTMSFDRCAFRGCKAKNAGGVIFSKATSGGLTVRNCLFAGNTLTSPNAGGSCIYTDGTSDVKIENCTFANNSVTATSDAAKSSVILPSSANAKNYVKNCVFWGNLDKSGTSRVTSTSKAGNAVFENCVADVSGLTGVTQLSPSPFVGSGNYTLAKKVSDGQGGRMTNPCLGAGKKLDWMTKDSKDLAGNPRLRGDDIVDLGCYELYVTPGLTLFVK